MGYMRRPFAVAISAGLAGLLGLAAHGPGDEPETRSSRVKEQSLHDDFETAQPAWEREHTDTTINLIGQDRSVRAAHDGKLSERFQFEAGAGSQFFVSYALPAVPVTERLEAAVHVRADRVGVQLYGRVVLPADIDPETRAPSFVLIPGTIYDRVDRWQRLELAGMMPTIERQARVLRASSRRPVSLKGAYLDRLVVNLLGGSGSSEVFLDDLSVSPVPEEIVGAWTKPGASKAGVDRPEPEARRPAAAEAGGPIVRLDGTRLRRFMDDRRLHDWVPTAIDAPGADIVRLRQYGFDLLVDDLRSDPDRIRTAVAKDFLLLPRLPSISAAADTKELLDQIAAYPYKDSVAFWMVGEGLGRRRLLKAREEELMRTRKLLAEIKQLSPGTPRLTTGVVDGDLNLFNRPPGNLDTVGIRPLLWASAQDPFESFKFLNQRRWLSVRSRPGGMHWAWIPVAAPPIVTANIWGEDVPPAWGMPRVLPEQIRLMTYMALSSGYRGLGYLGDADLTRPAGQAALIELAFLNEEIDLVESVLARSTDPIPTYNVFNPDPSDIPPPGSPIGTRVRPQKELGPRPGLQVASISVERKGALLLIADYAANAQYQPPQMAAHNLVIRAVVPESAQAYEISPGEVKVLERVRVPGGTQITLPDFGVTAMVLCTTDSSLADRVQAAIARVRPLAVQLAIEQAEIMFQLVTEINGRLASDGQLLVTPDDVKRRTEAGIMTRPTDERDLLARADASIKSAREAQEREDFALAWAEARRAGRPLRILMHSHWLKGFNALAQAASSNKPKVTSPAEAGPLLLKPVSCPPCIAFNTLPELYFWTDWISGRPGFKFGANRVSTGTFDDPQAMLDAGWVNVDHEFDGVKAKMATVPREGSKEDRMIRMSVEPNDKAELDSTAPQFFDFPVAAVRSPAIKVEAKNLIRISVLVKRSIASTPGMGGIIVRDSIGGEQFQFRTSEPIPAFSRVVLYRKAPEDGTFTVTLGLAGYGEAFFDDFRVELVEADDGQPDPDLASRPARRAGSQPPSPEPSLPSANAGRGDKPPRRR
jgi:hypothetical protein